MIDRGSYRGNYNAELVPMVLIGIFSICFSWLLVPIYFIVTWMFPGKTRLQQLEEAFQCAMTKYGQSDKL